MDKFTVVVIYGYFLLKERKYVFLYNHQKLSCRVSMWNSAILQNANASVTDFNVTDNEQSEPPKVCFFGWKGPRCMLQMIISTAFPHERLCVCVCWHESVQLFCSYNLMNVLFFLTNYWVSPTTQHQIYFFSSHFFWGCFMGSWKSF